MLKVKNVLKGGVGEELGIEQGDEIVEFDGFKVEDLLDYLYYDAQENFILTVLRSSEYIDFEIEKWADESLGLEFVSDNLEIKTCHNHCVFCFIDQMPKGCRDTLYVKDDDYRQSFLCGNYVTLTNVSDADIERIIRLNLSPLYVSVQATDGETRKKLLNNRFADKIGQYLKKLNDGGIKMHTQVVLVKDLNDGEILEKTMKELSELNGVLSLAVVPCGITTHREGLFKIDDINFDYANSVINQVQNFNAKIKRNFVLLADEFFVRAKRETEKSSFYGSYEQLENGVGMIRQFKDDFNEICHKSTYRRTFLVPTGVSAYPLIKEYAEKTEKLTEGLKVFTLEVHNKYFGETVTCTGLLVGCDVCEAVLNFKENFDELLISSVMLKDETELFLDGMTVTELSRKSGKPIKIIKSGGAEFFNALTSDGEN